MKKVLIISYYWPPAGGISPLRILKFVKYLRNFGWESVVFVPENADYIYYDENNFKDIPENTEIIKHKIIEPFKLFKLFSGRKKNDTNNPVYGNNKKKSFIDNFAIWVRGNFFIPDARALWIKPSVKYLSKYIEENKIDAILTDGPPHTNTMIAQKLAEKFNIPWLADFQDPWTQVDYYKLFPLTKRADKKHKRMEQSVFKTASKITIASPSWAEDLEKIGAENPYVIYYGYDEDDFKHLKPENTGDFIISHTGIMSEDRKPDTFFKAVKELTEEDDNIKQKIKIIFAGPVEQTVRDEIKKNNLTGYYKELGNIPREKALQLNFNSKILLLPINKADNAKGRIPGKLYEYLKAGNPILCLGPYDGDVANIISETNSGIVLDYSDKGKIKKFVKNVFYEKIKTEKTDISRFSNKNQTKKIAQLLDEITQK